jgi:hypothetical protein
MSDAVKKDDRKTYLTTERAGFVVAGRRIPPVYEEGKPARPKVGHELQLLDAEASYELAQGTIVLQPSAAGGRQSEASKPKPSDKPAEKSASKAN